MFQYFRILEMIEKAKKIGSQILALLFFASMIYLVGKCSSNLRTTKQEQENNQKVLLENIIKYQLLENGKTRSSVDALIFDINQFKAQFGDKLDSLDIKSKHVTNYSETIIQSEKDIHTIVRDSTVLDTVPVSVFNYSDKFYNLSGIIKNNQLDAKLKHFSYLTQVVYKGERYKPMWWIFSKRKLQQSIVSENPNDSVIFQRFINIKK